MKAMVLAAGLGSRLSPMTDDIAKPALPFMGKPIIVRVLEFLESNGVRRFVVNTHYLPRTIEKTLEGTGYDVTFSEEDVLLGTAGGLKKAEKYFRGGTFVMINADCYYEGDLRETVAFHKKSGSIATMLLKDYDDDSYNPVIVDGKSDRVLSIAGKPEGARGTKKIFTGIHILEPAILDHIPPGVPCDINSGVYAGLQASGEHSIRWYPYTGYWSDLGTPERMKRAGKEISAGENY